MTLAHTNTFITESSHTALCYATAAMMRARCYAIALTVALFWRQTAQTSSTEPLEVVSGAIHVCLTCVRARAFGAKSGCVALLRNVCANGSPRTESEPHLRLIAVGRAHDFWRQKALANLQRRNRCAISPGLRNGFWRQKRGVHRRVKNARSS